MTIGAVLNAGLSGLVANQSALRGVSQNVANVNTPGYARVEANFQSRGAMAGVDTGAVQRVADKWLQAASLKASATAESEAARSRLLDRAQSVLGDPSSEGSVSGSLSSVFSDFGQLAIQPTSQAARTKALSSVTAFYSAVSRAASDLQTLREEADSEIAAKLQEANSHLKAINKLNADIARSKSSGGDASGFENEQARALDDLSKLMDIRSTPRQIGGVDLRTGDGVMLIGGGNAATLSYQPVDSSVLGASFAPVMIRFGNDTATPLDSHIQSGELAGLMQARDDDLPGFARALGELSAQMTETLNAAHGVSSAYPAPRALEGGKTGLLGTDSHNFTGSTTIAVVSATGNLVSKVQLDFPAGGGAGTATLNNGASVAVGTTIADVVNALQSQLGANASVQLIDGQMTITAAGATNGVVLSDDATNPARRAGRSFAQTFRLNELAGADLPSNFNTGVRTTDAQGFAGDLRMRVRDASGSIVQDQTMTLTAGGDFNSLLGQLNNTSTGLGRFATYALGAEGQLVETVSSGYEVELVSDSTARATTGISFSQMFGIGDLVRAGRAQTISVRADIQRDPTKLATARPDLASAIVGGRVLTPGDNRGAQALSDAANTKMSMDGTGLLSATRATVSDFAARVVGEAGVRSAAAERAATSARAVADEASARRSSVEGVNLDEELVKMTTYQQAYAASSRLIQAAKDMYDILLNM